MKIYEKLKKFFAETKIIKVENKVTIEKSHKQNLSITKAANFKLNSSFSSSISRNKLTAIFNSLIVIFKSSLKPTVSYLWSILSVEPKFNVFESTILFVFFWLGFLSLRNLAKWLQIKFSILNYKLDKKNNH